MRVAAAIAAVGLSVVSGSAVLAQAAAQQAAAPATQADPLLLTQKVPTMLVWAIKPDRAGDFESAWAMIREQFAKSDRAEVKEFAATFGTFSKVDYGPNPPPGAPALYVFNLPSPSTTQSYHPGRIIYDFLYKIVENKEVGIPRTDADKIFAPIKDGTLYLNAQAWPLIPMKAGS